MARTMPPLASEFQTRVRETIRIAEIGEVARVEALVGTLTKRDLTVARVEYLYELAYLKAFYLWEDYLERVLIRYCAGYVSPVGTSVFKAGVAPCATLADAETAVLNNRSFALWHNPDQVIARSQRFFTKCPVESVVQSNISRLRQMSAIRHRIVHAQADAKVQFDTAAMDIAATSYRGSRAGALLRDANRGQNPPVRWLTQLTQELEGLARQIA